MIGILISLSAYIYSAALIRSRDSQRVADLQFIRNGLEQFYLDNRSYPIFDGRYNLPQATWQLEAGYPCQSGSKPFLAPKYLASLPQDPSHSFTYNSGSCSASSDDIKGQYLYFGLPKADSKTSFWLMARMERVQDINYTSADGASLSDYSNLPTFCDKNNFGALCSQDYFVTSPKNN